MFVRYKIAELQILDSILRQLTDHSRDLDNNLRWSDTRTIISIGDRIARVYGLSNCIAREILEFSDGTMGLALNLEINYVRVVLLATYIYIRINEGTLAQTTALVAHLWVGQAYLRRTLNALRRAIDRNDDLALTSIRSLESSAPGIIIRESVCEPLLTRILAVDAIIPIRRRQRELIIRDRQTRKTTVAIDTIINQQNCICVYVAIRQKKSTIAQILKTLEQFDSITNTTLIISCADQSSTLQFLAPYTRATIAEYFIYDSIASLTIYDDLTKHAQSYREICLLLRRPPAREAYPRDVFYLHSRLLERAAKLNRKTLRRGSITALPIVETQEGDVSAFVPTNVISITDRQLFFSRELFNARTRPAINVRISVSRVRSAAQPKAIKQVARQLKLQLAQFAELAAFAQLASDLDVETRQQLARGEVLREIIKQKQASPLSLSYMVALIYATTEFDIKIDDLEIYKEKISRVADEGSNFIKTLTSEKSFRGSAEELLKRDLKLAVS